MSRAATATPPPPPPYFPQRTSTPTMRHCANPSVNASHFAPRQYQHQHAVPQQPPSGHHKHNESGSGSGHRRKIKHLPSSLGGLRRSSSKRHAEPNESGMELETEVHVGSADDSSTSSLSHVPSLGEDDQSFFGSVRTSRSSRSDRSDRSGRSDRSVGSSVPSFGSFSSGNSVDSTTLPTPTTATGSFVLQQFPHADPAELEHALSAKSFAYGSRETHDDVHMDVEQASAATPTPGTTPNAEAGQGGSKSWVPHFGFGQLKLAKARAAVSTGLASFGEKRRRDHQGQLPKDLSLGHVDIPQSINELFIDTNTFFTSAAPGHANRAAHTPADSFIPAYDPEDVIRAGATFKPMADMTTPPAELLAACRCAEDADKVKEEWANAQRARLTQCAKLCSQWPLSGYHLSKFGPNGARHCYEPQSFSNPAHVANLMHRQAELEHALCRDRQLHFPATADKYAYRDVGASPPSPTVSDDEGYALRTAREIRRAMTSDLLSISVPASANSSQVSLVPYAPEQEVRPMHVKRRSAPTGSAPKSLHLSELNGFASSMALTQQPGVLEEQDMDDGDTDTTSLAPSLSSLRDSCDLGLSRDLRDASYSHRTASGPGSVRPSIHGLFTTAPNGMTRPARAQSCGSKRPSSDALAGSSSGARASRAPGAVCSGTGEEEKRRKVDEAMVVEEAVSTGVIMPKDRAENLGQAEEMNMVDDPMERMCASTPDLGSLRSRSATTGGMQQGSSLPRSAPTKMAFDAQGNAHAGDFGHAHARAFTAPAAPNHGSAAGAVFGHIVKTSDTHPIIISPFFPDELLPVLTRHLVLPSTWAALEAGKRRPLRMYSDIDVVSTLLSHVPSVQPSPMHSAHEGTPVQVLGEVEVVRSPSWLASAFGRDSTARDKDGVQGYMDVQKPPLLGNLLLSSCPGKRLRMDGPVKGRGPVCRDLRTDLERIKGEGVGCLVCCLDDAELALLGVPWETYRQVASEIGLDIVRLPMPDGFTPVSISLFDAQINLIATRYTLRGINVLVHCRGGVGRAGLTACAWAIKMGHVQPHPSLGVVEQRAMEQARERAEQVLAQQRRVEQQQQQQSATPTARGYKGFSLFPRSASSQTFNAAAAASSLPMDRAASGRYTSSTAGNADPGSFGTATTDHNAPAPTPDVPTLALPAELEHQIVMSTVERVIAMIRARRGLKAIESFEQVQFLVEYVRWLRAESR